MKRRLGVHTSIAGGLHQGLLRSHALKCNTLQIFSHNPRGWAIRSISREESSLFRYLRLGFDISPVYIHTSYLINMASRDNDLRRRSIDLLAVEMDRADAIGADYVVLHPGSASGEEKDVSGRRTVDALNRVAMMGRWKAGLLIENTAGGKGDISSTIVDLSSIINEVKEALIVGVCIDTCHAFAAGYDIGSYDGVQRISDEIERYIGLGRLKLIHLNDSKGDLGSGIDRHEHIGLGKIGVKGLRQFINCPSFKDVPLILETPKKNDLDDYQNLRKVRRMISLNNESSRL